MLYTYIILTYIFVSYNEIHSPYMLDVKVYNYYKPQTVKNNPCLLQVWYLVFVGSDLEV